MRKNLLAGLFLSGLALPAFSQPRLEYFPAELHLATASCPPGRKIARLSDFEDRWFSQHLAAAREPSLFEQSRKARSGNSYRFIWLRSFHAPVIVRVDENPHGDAMLTATLLSGKGGYEPGRIAKQVHRPLSAAERENLHRTFASSGFADFHANPCNTGLDGAAWIVEMRAGNNYRVEQAWSPAHGPINAIGMALLKLTGLPLAPIY